MKEKKLSDFIQTSSLLHLHDIHVWWTVSWEDPHKRKWFQPRSENFGTSFNQSSVYVQVNYIHPAKILISLKKAQHYIGYEIISSDSVRHLPPWPLNKILWICMNLMGGPRQGWGGARPSRPPFPVAMPLVVVYPGEFWTEFLEVRFLINQEETLQQHLNNIATKFT